MTAEFSDIVSCEVCELPHRRGVALCEECRHPLGSQPDWERLRAQLPDLRFNMVIGIATSVAIAVATLWVSGGWLLLVMPPLVWGVGNARRWYALSNQLKKRAAARDP